MSHLRDREGSRIKPDQDEQFISGQHIGNNIIRGCFASVFKYGTTPRAQSSPILGMRVPPTADVAKCELCGWRCERGRPGD
ncbi:unnamed protein product [Heligmosomoides polygyrus]|uniref:DNA-directed RNA polymerase n=1 Tax=Heligmosomoides polygyrus TaxID=6339 RepID=A0A183FG96_HELPZ|nr:unnamed protein product [Heligmosomoides polygyrus]